MSWWKAPEHPIWNLALVATVTCACLLLGYVNASHFDTGEITTALGTGAAAWMASRVKRSSS